MKIIKVNYMTGEARFVLEGFPEKSICIKLEGKTSRKEITNELKARLPKPDAEEQKFKDLKIKNLEGTEI